MAKGGLFRRRGLRGPEVPAPGAHAAHDKTTVEAEEPTVDSVGWQVGDVVADLYRVDEQVGAGGMGVVHRIHHLGWDEDLAVKSPHRELWDGPSGAEAFRNEAQVWIDLPTHPNICTCHYVREVDGVLRLFAEWVPGASLADHLRHRSLSTMDAVLDVAIQMGWGLAAAHQAGVVHQDVKPANVLIHDDGTVKITDFGIARAQQRAGAPTRHKGIPALDPTQSVLVTRLGMTPAYASPEQSVGGRVGRRTDVWSWAVTVLEMLVGELTWRAGPAAPKALRALGKRVALPQPLTQLLERCFAAEAGDRPDMVTATTRMIEVYEAEAGRPYPRTAAVPVERQADGLNNKALSMLDLGRSAEAEQHWRQGLATDARHPDLVFNYGLFRWRHGAVTDRELIRDLQAVCLARGRAGMADGLAEYLLGLVHLETGNTTDAIQALRAAAALRPGMPEIDSALRSATPPETTRDRVVLDGDPAALVNCHALNAEGTHLLGGYRDGRLGLWDLTDGSVVWTRTGHTGVVVKLAMTPDASRALSSANDGTVRYWDLHDGTCLRELDAADESCFGLALSADGRHGLSTSNKSVLVWDLVEGVRIRALDTPTFVYSVAVTPSFDVAVSGGGDRTLHVWDLATGRCVRTVGLSAPGTEIGTVSVTPDGRYAAAGCSEGIIRSWDLRTGALRCELTGHAEQVDAVVITSDGSGAVSCGWDGTIRWWDLVTGRCRRTYYRHDDAPTTVAILPGEHQAVTSGTFGTAGWWPLTRGAAASWSYSRPSTSTVLAERRRDVDDLMRQSRRLLRQQDPVGAARVLRRARTVPGYQLDQRLLDLWYAVAGERIRVSLIDARETMVLPADGSLPRRVTLTGDGRFAFGIGIAYDCTLWDLTNATRLHRLPGHTQRVTGVSMSGAGDLAVSASFDATVRVWDLRTGTCAHVLTGHAGHVQCAAIARDGAVAASGGHDKTTRVWDPVSGRCLHTLTGHDDEVRTVALSADGTHVASATWDTLRWWRTDTGECVRDITFDPDMEGVVSLALSPDGERLIIGGVSGAVLTANLTSTDQPTAWNDERSGAITAVKGTDDGKHVIAAASNDRLTVWDCVSGKPLHSVDCHSSSIETMDATPDGRFALVGGRDGTAKLWRFDWEYDI
ncbi:protein kinase domain-containing protein [Amycolatopsis japonica]